MGRIIYVINLCFFQWKKNLVFKTLNHSSTMLDDRDIIVPFIGFHLLSDFLPGKCLPQPSHLLFAREDFLWFPDKIVMPQKQFDSFRLRLFLVFPMESWWRRQWHPTPVLLPGKSHGWRSLVGCSPWGR